MPYIKSTYEYTKPRKYFGRQVMFQGGSAQMLDSINPDKKIQTQYTLRNPVDQSVQATTQQSEHEINTEQVMTSEEGINHVEGGWPREIEVTNEDAVARYCRRITHDDCYVDAVLNITPAMRHYVSQNNAIELYESYFADMIPQEPVEKCSIRIANVFRDRFKRPVSCIVWTCESNAKIVAAYSHKTDVSILDSNIPTACYVWDVNKQSDPIQKLIPQIPCWQLAGHPVDPEMFIAGLQNGTVNVFDIRESENCVSSSSVFNSHSGPVTSLLFTHSRTQTEFFTGSTDGQCLWWDLRNLTQPLTNLPISIKLAPGQKPSLFNSEGVSSLCFDHGFPTRFLCGTESGLVFNVNRMAKEHAEMLSTYWNAHEGVVRVMQRSPCISRMFLTCGDSLLRIWSDEIRTAPIIVTKPYRYPVMDASWSPQRYSSYMTICAGGTFYYWDILRKYQEPVLTLKIANHELTKMTPHSEGFSIVIGDIQGDLHLIQLSDNMVEPGSRDKVLMTQLYTRETHREHILDNRMKEIRLKLKAEEDAEALSIPSLESEDEDKDLQEAEEKYFKSVNKELSQFETIHISSESFTPHFFT